MTGDHLLSVERHFAQFNTGVNLGCYAEVFEETLMRRPELAPHGFAVLVRCVNQSGRFREVLVSTNPLNETRNLDGSQAALYSTMEECSENETNQVCRLVIYINKGLAVQHHIFNLDGSDCEFDPMEA